MATTGIWKVEKRLDHVIEYVMNPEKTIKDDCNAFYQELHNSEEYESIGFNTEESCYISALNCSTHRAYKDMMLTKEQYGKTGGILGFHAFQSFKEGEVTADKAHLIGLKLAEEMWGDRFEVIVTTHVNTNHIHNHFVINSVSFKDGKKYYDNRENLAKLRHLSDSLCQEYGLSVLEEKPCKKSKINYANYYQGYVQKTNYHTMAKEDIDRAISMAYSYQDFLNIMSKMGYEVTNRYGKLSIRRNNYKKNIRIERAFGNDYSISEIENRIETTSVPRVPFIEAYNPNEQKELYKKYRKNKNKGMYCMFTYYSFILNYYPKQYPNKMLSPYIREEIKKMNEISDQTRLLVSNKIETYEQLLFYKDNLENKTNDLIGSRHNLWIKHKRAKTNEAQIIIRNEINNINRELQSLRKEVVLCDGIIDRSKIIEVNIEEVEKNLGKEKEEK